MLFTLPQHLRETIAEFVTAGAGPDQLRSQLQAALDAPDVEEEDDVEELAVEGEEGEKRPPLMRPPTIDGELMDTLAAWSGSHEDELRSVGLGELLLRVF